MANSNAPFGLRPVRHLLGLNYNAGVQPFYIPAGYATALFIGDPVIKIAAGSNTTAIQAPGVGSFAIGTLPQINKAAAGATNRITGVIVGFAAVTRDSRAYNPASTERIAFVNVDPFTIYEVQADGAIPAADMGLNANLIFPQAGSTTTSLSGVELNSATQAIDATFQLILQRASNRADNDTTITRAKVEVLINLHTERGISSGVGI